MTLSQTLRSYAVSRGMTHRQGHTDVGRLARHLGVPKATLNNWLSHENKYWHKEPRGLARGALVKIVGEWDQSKLCGVCKAPIAADATSCTACGSTDFET